VSKKVRLYVLIGTIAVVLLGAGIVVGINLFTDRVNDGVPQADLFGPTTPPPTTAGTPKPVPSPTPPAGADIKGPLNILIVGLDTREDEPGWPPHADAVMIMHVNADRQSAYLTSLPRDLVVNIPAFAPAHFSGERSKLTHAMSFGAAVPGSSIPNPAQGFQLLARTISAYTHIDHFDAGAVITFTGMRNFINALGGIDMYIDQQVESIHLTPDSSGRAVCPSCPHGVTGPAATYNIGTTMHMVGWQALDYARQRYMAGGDYSRQRHQRQMIKAIMTKIIGGGYLMSMTRVDDLISSLGSFLLFDGRGRKPTEFAYALRNLKPDQVTLVGLPGTGAYSGGAYIGEDLNSIEAPFFAALNADTLPAFLAANPSLLNKATAG
jgi:anionic cell wall polymer biosynthesis LytR-Cps2A-Psr (LCP) family protein